MCKGACDRDGTQWQRALKLIERCKVMDAKEEFPLAAFHIAYVAMGLTIWQGGRQRRFALILCFLSHQGERKKEQMSYGVLVIVGKTRLS